jgi:hypothetical protein
LVVAIVAVEDASGVTPTRALPSVMRQSPSSPIHAVRPTVRCAVRERKFHLRVDNGVTSPRATPSEPELLSPSDDAVASKSKVVDRTTEYVVEHDVPASSTPVARFTVQNLAAQNRTAQNPPPAVPRVLPFETQSAPVPPSLPPQPLEMPAVDSQVPVSQPVTLTPIGRLSTNVVAPPGELPRNYAAEILDVQIREIEAPSDVIRVTAPFYSTPRAAGFQHRPLYFEERALEREGRNYGLLQPAVSGAKFFATLPILPYKMGAQPQPRILSTGDGIDPPGDHITHRDRLRGAVAEAVTATGLIFAIP